MIFSKFRTALVARSEREHRENGADIILVLFMLPIILAMTFSIIDLSTYFQTKMQVLQAVEYSTRNAALQGGAGANSPLNSSGVNQAEKLLATLYEGGQCTYSYCENRTGPVPRFMENSGAWTTTGYQRLITPAPEVSDFKVWAQCSPCVTPDLNRHVSCAAVYNYGGIGGAITRVLGLGLITAIPIEISISMQTEVEFTGLDAQEWACGNASTGRTDIVGS